VLGADLRSTVTAAQLADWSQRLRAAIGLPLPDLVLVRGDVLPDEAELRVSGQRVSRAVFRPGARRVSKLLWEQSGAPRPPDAAVQSLEGDDDVLWLPPAAVEAAGYRHPAPDVDGAIVEWIESRCRRSIDQLFDVELLVAFRRDAGATAAGRDRIRRIPPQLLRFVLLELVAEGVPIAARDAVLEQMADLALRVRFADTMVQRIREFLRADICRVLADDAGQVTTILLDERLEQALADRPPSRWISAAETIRLDAAIQRLVYRTRERAVGPPLVLVTVPRLRRLMARRLRGLDRRLPVLSFTELDQALIPVPGGLVDIELDPGPRP
jgi:type III secretory pathway component EscV